MSAADLITSSPRRPTSGQSVITRIVIYGLLLFFAIIYLVPLIVMVPVTMNDSASG